MRKTSTVKQDVKTNTEGGFQSTGTGQAWTGPVQRVRTGMKWTRLVAKAWAKETEAKGGHGGKGDIKQKRLRGTREEETPEQSGREAATQEEERPERGGSELAAGGGKGSNGRNEQDDQQRTRWL